MTRMGRSLAMRDVVSLRPEVERHREDAGVVVTETEARREQLEQVWLMLHPQRATVGADRAPARRAVRCSTRRARATAATGRSNPTRGGRVGLELGDDDDGQHDLVLVEALGSAWAGEEHAV